MDRLQNSWNKKPRNDGARGKKAWVLTAALLLSAAPMAAVQAEAIHIAAIVADDVITSTDLDDRRALIILTNHLPNTAEAQQKMNPPILQALINEALQLQEAKRLSIDISDAEITAAMAKIDAARKQPAGSFQRFLERNPALQRTVKSQLRAQLSWNKVVERKLRRSITIAQDEITRAQVAAASTPGVAEVYIAAISLPIARKSDEPRVAALAKDLSNQLNHGADFVTLAKKLASSNQGMLNPPTWVAESELQPAMQQALRSLQPKQITQPLRSQNSYQLINLLDRRTSKQQPDATEVLLKQISVPLPDSKDEAAYQAARALTPNLRSAPGSCDDTKLGAFEGKATASLVRATYGQMSRDLRGVVERLAVGAVSEPLLAERDIKLMLLCERIDPPADLPPAEEIRRKLFAEKLELEADKYLRNLRRETYVDVKGN